MFKERNPQFEGINGSKTQQNALKWVNNAVQFKNSKIPGGGGGDFN